MSSCLFSPGFAQFRALLLVCHTFSHRGGVNPVIQLNDELRTGANRLRPEARHRQHGALSVTAESTRSPDVDLAAITAGRVESATVLMRDRVLDASQYGRVGDIAATCITNRSPSPSSDSISGGTRDPIA